jgi:hypothetical protein
MSYAQPSPLHSPAALSVVAHVAILAVWAAGTQPPDSMPADSLANRVYYMPPPDKTPLVHGSTESVYYITFGDGQGAGPGPQTGDVRPPTPLAEHSPEPGPRPVDSVATPPAPPGNTADSVFTILEVDSAVVRSQSSAAPAYPLDLLSKHIEGVVTARYIVDTTGFADPASFVVVDATHPGFVSAVREALPYMRFSPAKIGLKKVRQLVEQPFTFRITAPAKGRANP